MSSILLFVANWKKPFICIAVAVIFLSCPFAVTVHAHISIGIIGDQFAVEGAVDTPEFRENLKTAYDALTQGIKALNTAGPMDTVLHVGDLVESRMSEEAIRACFEGAVKTLGNLKSKSTPKWYLTIGDHDVNPVQWRQNSPDRNRENFFRILYAKVNPAVQKHLYYSFDVNGYHFVALYALEHLHTDPRWGNTFLARISEGQLDWLKKDLARADTRKGVIVFLHQPLWYNWSSWLDVHSVLAAHNTKVVVAGHFHYDQTEREIDGIQYRVVGATGGMIKKANAASGGWWHVTRLTITDTGSVTWQVIPLGKETKKDFTDRFHMDRVQALSCSLSNAAQWLSRQKLYIRNGKLSGDCRSGSPPAVTVGQLGNPLDVKVLVEVALGGNPKYAIQSGRFAEKVCTGSPGDTTCEASENTWTAVSNASMVIPTCSRYTPDYLYCIGNDSFWKGIIGVKGTPHAGDTVKLVITMSYTSKEGETFKIWQDTPVSVEECR